MKRKHMHVAIAAAAALIACNAANAQQQGQPAQQRETQRSAWEDSLAYDDYLSGQALRASELIGAAVQNAEGEDLGEVKDLIVSRQSNVIEAVIAVGGLLGVGEKEIGVPYERLRVSADGETVFLGMTREQLEAEPAFEMPQRSQAAARGAGAEQQAAEQRRLTQQQTQARQQQAAQQAQERQQQAAQPQARAGEQQSAGNVVVMARTDRRASDLIGTAVVDSRGQEVGQIDDLVLSLENGTIEAVLAIGGVLGIGQRLVAVPLENLELGQSAAADREPQENTVRLDMTAQELQSRPEFQYGDQARTANVR